MRFNFPIKLKFNKEIKAQTIEVNKNTKTTTNFPLNTTNVLTFNSAEMNAIKEREILELRQKIQALKTKIVIRDKKIRILKNKLNEIKSEWFPSVWMETKYLNQAMLFLNNLGIYLGNKFSADATGRENFYFFHLIINDNQKLAQAIIFLENKPLGWGERKIEQNLALATA